MPEAVELLDELSVLCGDKESGNAAIAAKNGAVELIICVCAKLRDEYRQGLASVIHGIELNYNEIQFQVVCNFMSLIF